MPRFRIYEKLFQYDQRLQDIIALVYENIMEFLRRIWKFFRRRCAFQLANIFFLMQFTHISMGHSLVAWQILFDTLWTDFDSRFKLILGNLKRHKDLLDIQAVTSEMQEASTTRKIHEQKLDNIVLGIEAASTAQTSKLDNIALGIEAASTARTAHETKLDNIIDILGLEIEKAEADRKRVAAEYAKNEKARSESQRSNVVYWIDGIDCEDEKANASFHQHPNTELWLSKRQEFIAWFKGTPGILGVPGVLWLTGMPGCGLLPTLIIFYL